MSVRLIQQHAQTITLSEAEYIRSIGAPNTNTHSGWQHGSSDQVEISCLILVDILKKKRISKLSLMFVNKSWCSIHPMTIDLTVVARKIWLSRLGCSYD